jgi:hypothetical protein
MPIGIYKHKPWEESRKIGYKPWITGKKHSPETIEKMRKKASGAGNSQYGKPHSEEHKRKIGNAVKGEKHPMFGKHHTVEARAKIKAARARQIITDDTKEKLRKIGLGRKVSLETRLKMTGDNNPKWKGGKDRFRCIDCHKIVKNYKATRCRACNDLTLHGANCHFWRGGITSEYDKARTCLEYKKWRSLVFKRDRYKCTQCGDSRGGNLEADHIKPFAFFPKLRFSISNGRTLCHKCHKKTETYGYLAQKYRP